jgi:steroid delta-isomerase-like uncharacterized protein
MSDGAQLARNKKIAREYIQRVFNEHKPELAKDFVTADVVWHGGILGDIAGAENVVGLLKSFIGALPDLQAAEQDVVAEGDLVVIRLVVTATQRGDLLGIPASGTAVRWNAVDIYRFRDGLISEEWAADDIAAIMNQLGAFAPPWKI